MSWFSRRKVTPRDYAQDTLQATGDERWSSKFIYPNNWTMRSFRTVSVKEEWPQRVDYPQNFSTAYATLYLLTFLFLWFIVNTWQSQEYDDRY